MGKFQNMQASLDNFNLLPIILSFGYLYNFLNSKWVVMWMLFGKFKWKLFGQPEFPVKWESYLFIKKNLHLYGSVNKIKKYIMHNMFKQRK